MLVYIDENRKIVGFNILLTKEEAKKYFDEVKKFINENDEKNILNRCKIRD